MNAGRTGAATQRGRVPAGRTSRLRAERFGGHAGALTEAAGPGAVRVRVIRWGAADVSRLERPLASAGYAVDAGPTTREALKALGTDPPAAVVIDLARQPSHGREVAVWMRVNKTTRHIPIVFVEGAAEKVAAIRQLLPDATYAASGRVAGAVARAIAKPPRSPVTPASVFAGYSGTPLPKKLGVKRGAIVALVGAPAGFDVGPLPEGAIARRGSAGHPDLVLWFTSSRRQLEREIGRMALLAGRDGLWIIWPKQASGTKTDLTQAVVREAGLAAGLVDYKVCAVDATWSGLKFAPRRRSR